MRRIESKLSFGLPYIYSLYILNYFIVSATDLIFIPAVNYFGRIINIFVFGCLIITFLVIEKTIKNWIVSISVLFLAILSMYFTGEKDILIFFLFFFCSFNLNFNKFLKIDFITRLICFSVILLLFYLGVTSDVILFRDGVPRHSLGLYHPNTLGMFVFSIVIDYIALNWKKFRLKNFLVIFIALYFIYKFPNSLTAIYAILISIVFLFFSKFFDKKMIRNILNFTPVFLSVFSVYLAMMGNNLKTLIPQYDSLFSGRLWYFSYLYSNYKFTVFGNKILELDAGYARSRMFNVRYLDNSYLSLAIRYGFILFIIFIILLLILGIYFTKTNNLNLLFIIIIFSIYSFTENILFRPEFVIICMMGSFYAYKSNLIRENERVISNE